MTYGKESFHMNTCILRKTVSENRWAKNAFNEQFRWGQRDNVWTQACVRENTDMKRSYWLAGMQIMAKEIGTTLPGDWKNHVKCHHVKTFIQGKQNKFIHDKVQTHPILSLIGPLEQDHKHNSATQLWCVKM